MFFNLRARSRDVTNLRKLIAETRRIVAQLPPQSDNDNLSTPAMLVQEPAGRLP